MSDTPYVKVHGRPRNPVCWHCNRRLAWLPVMKVYVYAKAKIQGHNRLLHLDCARGAAYNDEDQLIEPSDFDRDDT